jgi:nickel/cobalt transporter (NicO) family protein
MITQGLWPFLLTGFTVSLLHAALPTHWLPFVLAGRAQKWSAQKTLSVLLIAGVGHILTTMAIGAGLVWFGLSLTEQHHHGLVLVSAGVVFLFGLWNIIEHLRGHRHSHCDHQHPHAHDFSGKARDGWAILSLLVLLTLSPCQAFIPVYISAWTTGWGGFLALSLALGAGTLLSLLGLTGLTYLGLRRFNMAWLENSEKLIAGALLMILAVVLYVSELGHRH